MPQHVFVDSSAWVAISDKDETYHNDAVQTYSHLLTSANVLVTTDLVVAEAFILLRRRLGHRAALAFLVGVNDSARIELVYADARLESEAKRILRQYDDQDFSLADAVSFALMRERRIVQAFAFDHHFATAGFAVIPPS